MQVMQIINKTIRGDDRDLEGGEGIRSYYTKFIDIYLIFLSFVKGGEEEFWAENELLFCFVEL